jgi:hypothetical protein
LAGFKKKPAPGRAAPSPKNSMLRFPLTCLIGSIQKFDASVGARAPMA